MFRAITRGFPAWDLAKPWLLFLTASISVKALAWGAKTRGASSGRRLHFPAIPDSIVLNADEDGEKLNESIPGRRRFWIERDGEHKYLEDVLGEEALEFVKKQNEIAMQELGEPSSTQLYHDILKILESKDKIPYVRKVGKWLYNFWDDEKSPRGVLRRCSEEEYKNASPEWETLLDFSQLGKDESESWVYKGYTVFTPDSPDEEPRRVLLFLSRGGGDASVVREYDLVDKAFVHSNSDKKGFVIPESKNWIQWKDADTLFVGTDFKDGNSMTDSGYPRTVRVWRRGTDLLSAQAEFEGESKDIGVNAYVYRHGSSTSTGSGYKYEVRHRSITFYTNEEWVKLPAVGATPDRWLKVPKQDDASLSIFQDQALIELRSDWTIDDGTVFPSGALISAPLAEFLEQGPALAGNKFSVIFRPTLTTSLYSVTHTLNFLAVTTLDNVKTRVSLWRLAREGSGNGNGNGNGNGKDKGKGKGKGKDKDKEKDQSDSTIDNSTTKWELVGSEAEASIQGISLSALDTDTSDSVWVTVSSFSVPSQLSLVSLDQLANNNNGGGNLQGLRTATPVKALPAQFDATGVVEQQGMAKSRDGTLVPYFLVCKQSVLDAATANGGVPTQLYGYGGFEVSMSAGYISSTGKGWVEAGGCYVVANIRGGGEYGPRWHKAALRENRSLAYDDFIAVAQDLIARGITCPQRLGIRGGSNGGLLMGNMLTRRPDLWGAVVCQVPLLDMRRYHKLLAGASWTAEYGDADSAEDWRFLQCTSPYHNIDPQSVARYPPLLMLTSTRDDRVHPYHARAFVARLLDVKEAEKKRLSGAGLRQSMESVASPASSQARVGGGKVLYYENIEGGHAGAADLKQSAFQTTLYMNFLWRQLGGGGRTSPP